LISVVKGSHQFLENRGYLLQYLEGNVSCCRGSYCSFLFHAACSFDFDDGIGGWKKTGTVFDNQPTFGDNPTARGRESAKQQGDWWIGGAEVRPSLADPEGQNQGDLAQGTLMSSCFRIVGRTSRFLLAEAAKGGPSGQS